MMSAARPLLHPKRKSIGDRHQSPVVLISLRADDEHALAVLDRLPTLA